MRLIFICFILLSTRSEALPVCSDRDAKTASNDLALSLFRQQGEVFHPARVLKKHSPSRAKEVASYIAVGQRRYSMFALVSPECEARFIKRTRQ